MIAFKTTSREGMALGANSSLRRSSAPALVPPRPFLWERGLRGEGCITEVPVDPIPRNDLERITCIQLPHVISEQQAPDRPLKSPHARSDENGRREIRRRTRIARAVTVIEVLFAMVVMLVGLVGMVALLPMAGRQASDSYSLTHGSATMQNAKASFVSMGTFEPTPQRPWWFADDEYATAPTANLGFQFPNFSQPVGIVVHVTFAKCPRL